MQIFIRDNDTGLTYTLDVDSTDSIDNLMDDIFYVVGRPQDQQVLMFRDIVLGLGRTLSDYGISHEHTIYLVREDYFTTDPEIVVPEVAEEDEEIGSGFEAMKPVERTWWMSALLAILAFFVAIFGI
jgi:hypothetical protein